MFIHVTKNKFIRQRDIIGVFDLDTSTVSGVTKNFLSKAEKDGRIADINILPKSFVLTADKKKNHRSRNRNRIYFSSNMTGYICKKGY